MHRLCRKTGFSLAEILICLAVLGVLALFTIPKLTQDSMPALAKKQTIAAQQIAFMVMSGYEKYSRQYPNTLLMRGKDLLPFLNYVSYDTTNQIEDIPGWSTLQCDANHPCVKLHNGGVLRAEYDGFCDSPKTALAYEYMPNTPVTGKDSNKSLRFYLYRDGRIRSSATMDQNTVWNSNQASGTSCTWSRNPGDELDPTWFGGF